MEGPEKHIDDTNDPHIDTNMIKWFNINEGTSFIGKLQNLIEDSIETKNHVNMPRLIELINLYVSITFLRSTIMLGTRCISHKMNSKSPVVSCIKNVINKEEESDIKFLKCLEEPTSNSANFFAFFNPSENFLIAAYAKSKAVEFQSLKRNLNENHFSLRSMKWPNHWAITSSNPWGTIWST